MNDISAVESIPRFLLMVLAFGYMWFWNFNYIKRRKTFKRHQRRVSLPLGAFFLLILAGIIKAYRYDLPIDAQTWATVAVYFWMNISIAVKFDGDELVDLAPWQIKTIDTIKRYYPRKKAACPDQ